MRRPTIALGTLLGGLTSLPAIALSFLAWRLAGLPFVPFDLFDWLARALPGDLITLGIDAMVKAINALKGILNLGSTSTAAKTAEQLLALALGVLGGVLLGGVVAGLLRRDERRGWRVGAAVGLAAFILVAAIELDLGLPGSPSAGSGQAPSAGSGQAPWAGSGQAPALALPWLALLLTGWGAVLGYLLRAQTAPVMDEATAPVEASLHAARRAALIKIAGGSALAALGAWGLGRLLGPEPKETGAGQPLSDLPPATPEPGAGASPALPQVTASATTRDRIAPAPGTRPELTPNEDFYRIDINTRPVAIDGASWILEVAGLFDNPRPLTLADLRVYPPVTQPITLSCISNPIGGDLIGTSNWIGVRLRDLLKDLGLRPEAGELFIEAADGFFESVAREDMMDPRTLLVYGMNGETLPVEHGFPLRIYIPDRYGMKQPKWITRIEAIDEEGPGYWVKRGWSAEARPQIVSVIDTIAREEIVDGRVPIGGIAWAGERGIQKVEVQVDDGEWVAATLRTPPLGPLTWVQWRYDWPTSPGRHTFRVRATDGSGALQIEQKQDVRPDGATGYHIKSVTI